MASILGAIAAFFAGLSVALGAFASHGLQDKLTERDLEIFQTGARYQMYHAIALLVVALFLFKTEGGQNWLIASGIAFIVGILLFSGSLYGLSLTQIKILGAIAPLGGAAFMIGWGCLGVATFFIK